MTAPRHGIRLVLPPGWVNLPLHDEAARGRVICAMVDSLALDDGPGAQLRRELRRELTASADDAAAGGAVLFALSTSGPGGVPLPASLVVSALDIDDEQLLGTWWAAAAGGGAAGDARADDVAGDGDDAGAAPTEADGAQATDQALLPIGRVVRRVLREPETPTSPASVRAEYWVTPAEDTGAYHVVMSTPLVSHGDAMLGMFDAIVSTARVGPPS